MEPDHRPAGSPAIWKEAQPGPSLRLVDQTGEPEDTGGRGVAKGEIAIIGAGMAGLACARRLTDAGHAPVILDKGRGIGGR